MMFFYNIGIRLYGLGIRLASLFNPKAREWVRGRRGLNERLKGILPEGSKTVWVHCASLGEFEQGRPVIERIRRDHPEYRILLTFFSPSGYRIRRNYENADAVVYLPLDTPRNVRRFLDAVKPDIAIFVKYEFWLNYLRELGRRDIRTYIVSAIFRPDSIFFRPYGGAFRKALGSFTTIFVQNDASRQLLAGIGIRNVVVSGDTRFDRVAAIPEAAKVIPAAERFVKGAGSLGAGSEGFADSTGVAGGDPGKFMDSAPEVIVAGSTWPQDEQLLAELAKARPDVKFIIAPHEIEQERIDSFIASSPVPAVKYSACDDSTDMGAYGILIVDTIGLLSSMYRYGKYAYIGGGFGAGIHNTLEAATFGLPVAFGPNYTKFREARELIALRAATPVTSGPGLLQWYEHLASNPQAYAEAKAKALSYIAANKGATDTIIDTIFASAPAGTDG